MSLKQKPNLAAALAESAGSRRSARTAAAPLRATREATAREKTGKELKAEEQGSAVYQAPSRSGTVPITVHFPKQVRDQLKILAIERGGTLHDITAEAYNDLFAKYGKPEIAPHQSMNVDK